MEDPVDFFAVGENQMELYLESDEEEASLLEEMERQEASRFAKSPLPEGLLQLKSVFANMPENYESTGFSSGDMEMHGNNFAGIPKENYESVQGKSADGENETANVKEDLMNKEPDEESEEVNVEDLIFEQSDDESEEVNVEDLTNEQSDDESEDVNVEDLINEQPDDESEKVNAKDFMNELPDSAFGKETHQDGVTGWQSDNSVFSSTENTVTATQGNADGVFDGPLTEYTIDGIQILRLDMSASELLFAKTAAALRPQFNLPQQENTNTGTKHKTKQKNKKSVKNKEKQTVSKMSKAAVVKEKRSIDTEESRPPAKKRKLFSFPDQAVGKRAVIFSCTHCNFRCAFEREYIDKIVAHLTPRARFNQLQDVPEKLLGWKESVKLNVLVAKNKAKAQVRLLSRIECASCKNQFCLDVDTCDKLAVHHNWCGKSPGDKNYCECIYCKENIHRFTIKRHLCEQSKKACQKFVPVTLQLMSAVCKEYAEEHRPVCIVCNEQRWPFIGHRAELNPVCEPCRVNITSGKTTKLTPRDMAGCAICSSQCSKKFVTYWASEMETLFIGENCIKKLRNPVTKRVITIADNKEHKIRGLVEMAISSSQISGNLMKNPIDNSSSKFVVSLKKCIDTNLNQSSANSVGKKSRENKTSNVRETKTSETKTRFPVPKKVTDGHFVPITGSFRITNGGNPLPFATLATVADDTTEISQGLNGGKGLFQNGEPYTLLLPNDTSNLLLRSSLPSVAKNAVDNPKTVFRAHESSSVVSECVSDKAPEADTTNYKENTGEEEKITRIIVSSRPEAGGSVLSSVSPNQLNYKSWFQVNSTKPSPLKYIVKLQNNSVNTVPDESKHQQSETKSNHIIIRTSSSGPQRAKSSVSTSTPRIAKVIKYSNSVFSSNMKQNDLSKTWKSTSRIKQDADVVTLD
ncbi:uncharacterized protein LOC121880494 [Homarus americanus]|nr:uncharacterized protein LOC121880494 [Homarus americanus]